MSSDIFFFLLRQTRIKKQKTEAINNNPESLKEWITKQQRNFIIYVVH